MPVHPALISLVIPVYNEQRLIQASLERIVGYLRERFPQFEVIVVDDGSTDRTKEKIAEIAREESRLITGTFRTNHGKGFAVREGILRARGDVIAFTDADLSTPIEELELALEELSNGYPVVIASRRHPSSTIRVRQNRLREMAGVAFNILVRALLPLSFKDTQCGFKCFTQEAARQIFSLARIDGFAFDVEVLLIALRLGYSVKEIPVCWTDFPDSKVTPVSDLLPTLSEISKIYVNDFRKLYRPISKPSPQVRYRSQI